MSYNLTEEELHEVHNWMPKAEQLVRLGMMPVAKLPYIKRALVAIQQDAFLPLIVRKPFYEFLEELLELAMGEPGIYRLIRNKVAANRNDAVSNRYVPEEVHMEDQEQLDELSKGTHERYQKKASETMNAWPLKITDKKYASRDGHIGDSMTKTMGIKWSDEESVAGNERLRNKKVRTYKEETMDEAKTSFKKLLRPNFYKDEKHKANDTETKEIADTAHSKAEVTEEIGTVPPQPRWLKGRKLIRPNFYKDEKHKANDTETQKITDKAHSDVEFTEDVDFRKTPLGMLQTLAGMVKMKKRAGGKVATNDRIQATKARNEIRRRKYFGEGLDTTFLDVADALADEGVILNEAQLDELSKRHLAAYVEKSAADMAARSDSHGAKMAKAGMRDKDPTARPFTAKIKKRFRGIVNASHKMASEEVEQIDELSKETKASYVKKADKDHDKRYDAESHKSYEKGKGLKFDMDDIDPKDSHKIEKREKGIKMAKESLDESYQLRFTAALEKFGVQNFAELDDTSAKDFLAYVDTQNEAVVMAGRGGKLPMSADMKAQVARDMEKRKAAKEAILQSAKADVANKDIKRKGGLLALPKDYDRDTSQDKKRAGQR